MPPKGPRKSLNAASWDAAREEIRNNKRIRKEAEKSKAADKDKEEAEFYSMEDVGVWRNPQCDAFLRDVLYEDDEKAELKRLLKETNPRKIKAIRALLAEDSGEKATKDTQEDQEDQDEITMID